MATVVYTICYLLNVYIQHTNLECVYHTSHQYLKRLDIITLSFPLLLIITSHLVH